MEGGRANGPWAVTCDGLAGVGCCNSGIPRENTELKTGSANSVGKSPQPISLNFPEFFPDFVFFPKIRHSIGKIGIRCQSVRDFPLPAFIPSSVQSVQAAHNCSTETNWGAPPTAAPKPSAHSAEEQEV